MKFKKYLLEKFYGSRKAYSWNTGELEDTEFFVNPTPGEIRDAYKASGTEKAVRFLVDFNKKNVIVWEASVLHKHAFEVLKIKNVNQYFYGEAVPAAGKMFIMDSDSLKYLIKGLHLLAGDRILELLSKHKSWLSKYFKNVDKFIEQIQM